MKLSTLYDSLALLFSTFIFTSFSVNAQHTSSHLHQQNTDTNKKNIFISMMDAMMVGMDEAVVGISPEHDFTVQMIPHHQGAIEMAAYEIEHGKNFEMIQLAKSIQAEQKIELQQMKLFIKNSPAGITLMPKEYKTAMDKSMAVMMENMPNNSELKDVDIAFARVMIPHHQAAIDMAKVVLQFSKNQLTNAFAKHIISSEKIEIEQMLSFISKQ
ncbi:DUF305 domain-containing protein [Flavobacterium aquidurense]|uniref:DUF305 domain-containing protein n=1 Tax=Flavobacterium TaxID=237 RepID=UPI003757B00F